MGTTKSAESKSTEFSLRNPHLILRRSWVYLLHLRANNKLNEPVGEITHLRQELVCCYSGLYSLSLLVEDKYGVI